VQLSFGSGRWIVFFITIISLSILECSTGFKPMHVSLHSCINLYKYEVLIFHPSGAAATATNPGYYTAYLELGREGSIAGASTGIPQIARFA
jgi:hypothetical protein